MDAITDRQAELLRFIAGYITENEVAPTIREMRKGMSLASESGIICHLHALEKKGYIKRQFGAARWLKVLRYPEAQTAEVGNV